MGKNVTLTANCDRRLTNLYNESHIWLLQASYNITKSKEESEDLVSELYLYLQKKCNPKIFWGESYNVMYCHAFLKHRWFNKLPKLNRYVAFSNHSNVGTFNNIEVEEYDVQRDMDIMKAHQQVMEELDKLQTTRLWPKARLFKMYWCSDDTLTEVAEKIGISKSTTFIAIKKIRQHLSQTIENPFKK